MSFIRGMVAVCLGAMAMADASAVAYRCEGANGKVTYADRPCEVDQQTVATLGGKGKVAPTAAAASAAQAASAASAASAAASQVRTTAPAKR